mgnify:CR=1 FL=1
MYGNPYVKNVLHSNSSSTLEDRDNQLLEEEETTDLSTSAGISGEMIEERNGGMTAEMTGGGMIGERIGGEMTVERTGGTIGGMTVKTDVSEGEVMRSVGREEAVTITMTTMVMVAKAATVRDAS